MTTRTPDPYHSRRRTGFPAASQRPRRSRTRVLVSLATAAWTIGELWLLTVVAARVGALVVILLLLGGVVAGTVVIRRAGRRAWRRLAAGLRPDGGQESAANGDRRGGGDALAMLGGLLLMLPGLLSDVVGLLCVFPPTAALVRRGGQRLVTRRGAFPAGSLGDAMRQARTVSEQVRMHRPDGKVVPGEVLREERPPSD